MINIMMIIVTFRRTGLIVDIVIALNLVSTKLANKSKTDIVNIIEIPQNIIK